MIDEKMLLPLYSILYALIKYIVIATITKTIKVSHSGCYPVKFMMIYFQGAIVLFLTFHRYCL